MSLSAIRWGISNTKLKSSGHCWFKTKADEKAKNNYNTTNIYLCSQPLREAESTRVAQRINIHSAALATPSLNWPELAVKVCTTLYHSPASDIHCQI